MPALTTAPTPSVTTRKAPLHERVSWLGYLRGVARGALFGLLRKLAGTDDAKAIQVASLRNLLPRRPDLGGDPTCLAQPYADLGGPSAPSPAATRDDVIFITARFRTGSTALWNLFRHLDGYTAYYEPFNERRWFDPVARGHRTDPTHRQVNDYWREYEGLADLGRYYRESWIDQDLFMDAQSWNPDMKRYVETLVERAPGRPVLQFNRVDFRLPWLRHVFPRATLLHLYRHPRDQWYSSLVNPTAVPRDVTVAGFAPHDHFYLRNWARDLKYYFPFLDEGLASHPYQLFYYLWKLSYLFGRRYAHHSLAFEDLTAAPERTLETLFDGLGVKGAPVADLARLVEKPRSGRWSLYAPEGWFREQEAACEEVLAEFFRTPEPPAAPRSPGRPGQPGAHNLASA
jgi:hypothetical protein